MVAIDYDDDDDDDDYVDDDDDDDDDVVVTSRPHMVATDGKSEHFQLSAAAAACLVDNSLLLQLHCTGLYGTAL